MIGQGRHHDFKAHSLRLVQSENALYLVKKIQGVLRMEAAPGENEPLWSVCKEKATHTESEQDPEDQGNH